MMSEGLKFSDGVKLKVLLYVLRNADKELDNKAISACTGVNVTDIPEALDYWVNMGILHKDNQVYSPVNNSEKEDYYGNSDTSEDINTKEPVTEKETADKEKPLFTVTKPSEAQTALGKVLSNADISTLLMLKDTCGLPLDVILMLIQYAISIDKGNMRTIERLGVSWANDGVNSVEEADNKIRLAGQRTKCYSIVSAAFGLKNAGSPSKKQLDYCSTWVTEWKFSPDMLREAYERCVDSKGEMKFNYIDGILKRWHNNGIQNKNDLADFESSKKNKEKNTSSSSYDIEELEQINRLEDYE